MEPDQGQKLVVGVKGISKKIISAKCNKPSTTSWRQTWTLEVEYRGGERQIIEVNDNEYKTIAAREKLELLGADPDLLNDLEELAYQRGSDDESENHECDTCECSL